jgi:hypothetical protein
MKIIGFRRRGFYIMKQLASPQIICSSQPLFSSQTQGWEQILVEEFHHPAGEGKMLYPNEHVICLSLAPRPVRLLHILGDKSYTGIWRSHLLLHLFLPDGTVKIDSCRCGLTLDS